MARSWRAARAATFVYFGLNGFILGIWIVHIPAIKQQTGVSDAVFGWLLLLLGLGAFIGMRLVGPLADRYGARRVVPAGAALCSVALAGPALAGNAATLGAALLALGVGNGSLDVSMNTHAVQVEARYGRPVMAAFHAVFSVGGLLAALVGARAISWGWSALSTMSVVAVLGLLVAALAAPALLPAPAAVAKTQPRDPAQPGDRAQPGGPQQQPGDPAQSRDPQQPRDRAQSHGRTGSRHIWALAGLALMLMLSEGVANDWSVLAARDSLHAPAAVAALAYAAFAGAMTVGRFLADHVTARIGPVAIVRYGSALAALSLATVALSPWIALTIGGWGMFGIGLSGSVPQLFSAAGHADPAAAGVNVSRVASLGYLGQLAGPAVIGPLTHLLPLVRTFFLPVALCAVAALAAGLLRPVPGRNAGPAADSTQEAAAASAG
jgi:MFS family permease